MTKKKMFVIAASALVVLAVVLLISNFFGNLRENQASFIEKSNGRKVDEESSLWIHNFEENETDNLRMTATTEEDRIADNNREKIEYFADSEKLCWRILTWFGKPCVGSKVIATEVSPVLVSKWLAMCEKDEIPSPLIYETVTGNDGSFGFPDLGTRIYYVRAEFEGFASSYGLLDLSNGWVEEFTLELRPEKTIRGSIVDCSGCPIEEIDVHCVPFLSTDITQLQLDEACNFLVFTQMAITDHNGEFRFRGLPVDPFWLYLEPEGFIAVERKVDVADRSFQKVVLKKPCVLKGRIADRNGNLIEGASICYMFPQGGLLPASPILTDEKGIYRFDDAPEGGVILQATHEEQGNTACRIYINPDAVNIQDLVLPGGVKIELKVTDDSGSPLEGAHVQIDDWTSGAWVGGWTTTEDGLTKITGINKGSQVRVTVKQSGYHSKYSALHSFCESGLLNIQLKRRALTRLKIFDSETEELVTQYHVCICPFSTFTGVKEKFHIQRGVVEFDYEKEFYEIYVGEGETFGFIFLADGYLPAHVTVVPPGPEIVDIRVIDVPLKKGGVLTGLVVDAVSGFPVQGASIQLYVGGTLNKKPIRTLSKARVTASGVDGSFCMDGLASGRHFIKVEAPGYGPTLVDSCELDPRAGVVTNIVKLWPGGVLSGTVHDIEGNPLEEATVQVIPPGTDEAIVAKTRPDGTYILPGLPAGELVVLVEDFFARSSRGAWMKLRKVVSMPPGGARTADFSFAGSCIIQGTCSYQGRPGWGVALNIIDSTGVSICSAHSSDNGYYRIFGIPPGTYTLEAHSTLSGAGGCRRQKIELAEGQELALNIDLTHKAVYGQVKGSDGTPIHGAIVELLNYCFERSHSTFTDQNGNYTILSVEEGMYSVTARADNFAETILGPWLLGSGQQVQRADFSLKDGGIGRIVVDSQESRPVQGALVYLTYDPSKNPIRRGMTGSSGVCVFESLGTETCTVLANAMGYAPGGQKINVAAGERTTCNIELERSGDLLLEVKTADGKPIPGAYVNVSSFSLFGIGVQELVILGLLSSSDPKFVTDESGKFILRSLPSRSISFRINKGFLSGEAKVSIIAGKMSTVTVILD